MICSSSTSRSGAGRSAPRWPDSSLFNRESDQAHYQSATARRHNRQLGINDLIKHPRNQVGLPCWGRLDGLSLLQIRSEEHTSELQSLMRISYAVFCLKKKKTHYTLAIHYKNYDKSIIQSKQH